MQQSDTGIAGYAISRRIDSDSKIVLPFSPIAGESKVYSMNSLTDSTVAPGKTYTYSVRAIDRDQNRGNHTAQVTITFKEVMPIPPIGIKITGIKEGLNIQWNRISFKGIQSVNLYRYQDGHAPMLLATLSPSTMSFVDTKTKSGINYTYYLTSINAQGKESRHSKEVIFKR